MRLASVGYGFEDKRVAEVEYGASRTLLDFDVVLWDPAEAVPIDAWERDRYGAQELFEGLPTVTKTDSPGVGMMMRRRAAEMEKLLSLGKVVVIFLPRNPEFFLHTGKTENLGTPAKPRIQNLVAKQSIFDGLPLLIEVAEAEGDRFELKTGAPFAAFWRACSSLFAYRSFLTSQEAPPALVIPGTDLPVARIEPVGDGTVILLPDFAASASVERDQDEEQDEHVELAPGFIDALVALIEELRGTGAEGPPSWTEQYLLPGEHEVRTALGRDEEQLAGLLTSIDEKKAELALRQRAKSLFSGTGRSLELEVRALFSRLGCRVEEGQPGRTDLIVHHGDHVAVVEVKGVTGSAAEKHAAQLEKWVSEYYEEHELHPKPILVVNAYRDQQQLSKRALPFPPQMLSYSESRDHCLVTGLQLLGASVAAEGDGDARERIVDSLFGCVGVWPECQSWDGFLAVDTLAPAG